MTRTTRGRLARLNDLLVDELFGHLSRYALAGGVVFLWAIGVTFLLSGPATLPIQGAIPIAYVTAGILHYTLQRRFVFRAQRARGYALSRTTQLRRYLPVAVGSYALTALGTAVLPGVLDLPERLVYVCCAVTVSGLGFLTFRSRVFHSAS